MVRVVVGQRDHGDDLAAVDVEHHAGAADGLEHFHLARDLAGDDSLHACIDRQRDVLAGGQARIKRFFQPCQTFIVHVDLAEDVRCQLAAGVAAKGALAEIDARNAKTEDFGVTCRCQLAVELDIAGLLRQQPQ